MSALETPSSLPSALLSFAAENVRSYRDEVYLPMHAGRLSEKSAVHALPTAGSPVRVLPAAGIFGANASGKSTLLKAIDDMRKVVLSSFRQGNVESGMYRRPFLLDDESARRPSSFEIDLIVEGVRWQYGFEFDDTRVLNEFAFHYPNGRKALVFERDGDRTTFGPRFRSLGRLLLPFLRGNSLLLSVAGATAHYPLSSLFLWFRNNFQLAESDNRDLRCVFTADMSRDLNVRERVLLLLRSADLGITDIERVPTSPEIMERMKKAAAILTGNEELNDDEVMFVNDILKLTHSTPSGSVALDAEDESLGTLTWIGLIGPILFALGSGTHILIDELDSSLHPLLVQQVIRLFQDPKTNPKCSQLIFNSHDPTLLEEGEFPRLGRDQIWFAEKDLHGITSIYPLSSYNTRKDEAFMHRYLFGRYGGIPNLDPADFELATT